jgi:AbrB family looped-hinge helix DNA binding protein
MENMKIGKVSSRDRVTLPKMVREYLRLHPGDSIFYELADGTVVLRRLEPFDPGFHSALAGVLDEWNSPEDETAFRDLEAINRNAERLNEEAEDVLTYQTGLRAAQ